MLRNEASRLKHAIVRRITRFSRLRAQNDTWRASFGHAPPQRDWDRQAVRRRRRARRRGVLVRGGRDPRPPRRERRRQEHDGEGALRRPSPGCGHDHLRRRDGHLPRSVRRGRRRHRPGLPGALARPGSDRRREPLHGRGAAHQTGAGRRQADETRGRRARWSGWASSGSIPAPSCAISPSPTAS